MKIFRQKVAAKAFQNAAYTESINSQDIYVREYDHNGLIVEAYGTAAAATQNAQTRYAKGARYTVTGAATGVNGTYVNVGTTSSSSFQLAASGSGENVTAALYGTVASGAFPFNVETETEAAAAFAKVSDGGSFANLAVSGGEAGYTANYQLFPDTEAEDDAVYFGASSPFGVIVMDVDTVATYGADSLAWEYWDGSAWTALTIIYDETDTTAQDGLRSFQQDGHIIFSAPSDWESTTVDSQAAYWVRARVDTGFNITQIPTTNSVEHKTVSAATATEMPSAGTIGRARISWITASGSNNDTKVILCNLTKGTASAITTLTQALVVHEVANFNVACDAGDQIAMFVTQEDGTTEFANGIMELTVTKS